MSSWSSSLLRVSLGAVDDALDVLLELRLVGLAAVEDRAPHSRDGGHRDRFLDLLVGCAVESRRFGGEVDAVFARDLRRDGEPDQLLGLAVEPGGWIHLEAGDAAPERR